jgi:hypothetical protein
LQAEFVLRAIFAPQADGEFDLALQELQNSAAARQFSSNGI